MTASTLLFVATPLVLIPGVARASAATCLGQTVTIDLSVTPDATGTDGNDVVLAGSATQYDFHAGAGNDLICGGERTMRLYGDAGNDHIVNHENGWQAFGGEGDDILEADPNGYLNEFDGGPGNDILRGGPGRDTLIGGPGDDRIGGRGGRDTVSYQAAPSGVRVFLSNVPPLASGGDGNDLLAEVERVLGSAYDDELVAGSRGSLIEGGAGNDRIRGGAGNDDLVGNAGNDRIGGGYGTDVIRPESGNDVVVGGTDGSLDVITYTNAQGVVIDLSLTGPQNTGSAGVDTLQGMEVLVGSGYADILRGSSRADRIYGRYGNDRINGRAGNDRLYGEEGNDILDGSTGSDTCSGGPGRDIKRSC